MSQTLAGIYWWLYKKIVDNALLKQCANRKCTFSKWSDIDKDDVDLNAYEKKLYYTTPDKMSTWQIDDALFVQ